MNQTETRKCQNCHSEFVIEPDDFAFYQKIQVPPPTFCPECRLKRRMVWRNERFLYKRKSSLSGEEIISQFHKDAHFPVYGLKEYFARDWKMPSIEYNPGKSFFEQFKELLLKTPKLTLLTDLQSVENNSVYQNASSRNKNCYMVSAAGDNEDCLYGNNVDYCKNVVDGLGTRQVQYSYECIDCMNCSNILFSEECRNCANSYFLYECKNCSNCFGCVHLRHKSYWWFNERLSKEEYEKKLKDFLDNFSVSKIDFYRKKLEELRSKYPVKFAHMNPDSTPTCTGDYITDSKNVTNSFFVVGSENSRYCAKLIMGKDCYDMSDWGDPAELCYESITVGKKASEIFFSNNCWPECRNIQYCDSCSNSHHLFGCIGLKNASYCILNKQYTKEEYEELVPKIIEHMNDMPYIDAKGREYKYGEFFPPELSPFAYNETIAQEYFPLSEAEAKSKGYRWKDPEERNYEINVRTEELKDNIKDVKDNIIGKVIECAHQGKCNEQCTTAFKIIPDELAFYRKMNLPLPRLCPNCRHYERLKQRNPLKLWRRKCMCAGSASSPQAGSNYAYQNTAKHFHGDKPCPGEFQTSYAPDRKEIVYCESCYNAEVV